VYIKDCILSAITVKDPSEMPEPEPEPEPIVYGDANGDGVADSTDAMLVLQYDALLIEDGEIDVTACDVNGDGSVDSTDAMLILQYDALLIEFFPVEE
jgi:hypothetical protein